MRSSSSGLGDLRRLQQEARQARERQERERREQERLRAAAPDGTASPAGLPESERSLFRRAAAGTVPLAHSHRRMHAPLPPADAQARRERALGAPPAAAAPLSDALPASALGADGTYVRPGAGPDLARRLRRRQWPVLANLDLHGMTVDAARDALQRFLDQCREQGLRCVRVVHGQGYGSPGGVPVLREKVAAWLAQAPCVQAYVPAGPADGGQGAAIVLLESAPGTREPF